MQPLTSPEYVRQVILSTLTAHETDTFPDVTHAARQALAGFLRAALSLVLLHGDQQRSKLSLCWHPGRGSLDWRQRSRPRQEIQPPQVLQCLPCTCAETLLRIQLEAIAASPLISILLDNSTDKSTEEHCLIYIRYLDMNSLQAKTEYLCTVQTLQQDWSLHVSRPSSWCSKSWTYPSASWHGLCTDGDSAIIGNRNGVRGLLRQVCPYLLSAHCAAHKSALVMSDVEKNHPLVQQVDSVLKDTHNFFSCSPKKGRSMEALCQSPWHHSFQIPHVQHHSLVLPYGLYQNIAQESISAHCFPQ